MVEPVIWDQIVVDRRDRTSPYRQIANVLRHKIATNQIRSSTELPSVRTLAERVGVTPATVARAYKQLQSDGLIESVPGVGTVVADTQRLMYAAQRRSFEELDDAVDDALSPLLQHGYTPTEIRNAVDRRLARSLGNHLAVIVTDSPPAVNKYLHIMQEELGPVGVQVRGLLLADAASSPEGCALLKRASRVLTSLGLLRRVQAVLRRCQASPPISVIFTELKLSTIEELSAIPSESRTLLVAEERYRNSILGILRQHLLPEHVTVLRTLEADALRQELASCDVVVYSLSQRDLVQSTVGSTHQTILMDYQVRPDALAKLRETFLSAEAAAPQ